MASGLRVLLTNNTLAHRAGSELFVRDLAAGLVRRGHAPIAYSSVVGDLAGDLVRGTVPVVSDLSTLAVAPDVIHAQHHLDAMCALLRFPDVPAVHVCHGWVPWEETPPVFPSIARYVAVDDLCRERLETTPGIAVDRIATIYNAVDLGRFRPRSPLPSRPRAALVFSNYASDANMVGPIREACAAAGIDRVDVVGRESGRGVASPELVLPDYDIVFAKARCALEAMAVGCAVIVADVAGLGGLVTPDNVERMRRLNFGVRVLQAEPVSVDAVTRALAAYSGANSQAVSRYIREHADFERALDQFEALYHDAIAERRTWSVGEALHVCAAASTYLASIAGPVKRQGETARALAAEAVSSAQRLAALSLEVSGLRDGLEAGRAETDAARAREAVAVQRADVAEAAVRCTASLEACLTARDAEIARQLAALSQDVSRLEGELKAILRSRGGRTPTLAALRRVRARLLGR